MKRVSVVLVVLSLACAGSLRADPDEVTIVVWKKRMAETVALLQAQKHEEALRDADRTIEEMMYSLGPGDAALQWFCITLTHKALAHAGLHQNDDALWYWHSALTLYPKLAEADLSTFGEAGAFLKANIRPLPCAAPPDVTGPITPPKWKKKFRPEYPNGANVFNVDGQLVVEAVITADGHVRSPRIIRALDAVTLSYAALESIKRSRFEPGRVGGTPIDVTFTLTVKCTIR